MKKDAFDLKTIKEFSNFIQNKIKFDKEPDIYSELVKQLILKSYCAN